MAISPRIVLVAASLLAGACAPFASAADEGSQLSDTRPDSDRSCRGAGAPRELPAADAMVDSAALSAQLVRLWSQAGEPAGHVLLALRYDADGTNVRRDVLEHRVTEALADSVQRLVFAARRTTRPADREWGVRMRVELGDQPVLRVLRSQECGAQPLQRSDPTLAGAYPGWGDIRDSAPPPTGADGGLVWVRVALDEAGRVTDARVERGVTRDLANQRLLQYVRMIAFNPATVDGYPVPGEATIPLRLH